MRIIHATDYEDMSRKAANIIAAQVVMDPACVLGLATGSSPLKLYAELVRSSRPTRPATLISPRSARTTLMSTAACRTTTRRATTTS